MLRHITRPNIKKILYNRQNLINIDQDNIFIDTKRHDTKKHGAKKKTKYKYKYKSLSTYRHCIHFR